MYMQIIIPNYRTKSRNQTTRKHWIHYRQQLAEMTALVRFSASLEDRTRTPKYISPARVIIEAKFKGARGVDTSNIDDKIIIDALMEAGFLLDDDPSRNPEVVKRSQINTGVDELIISVLPLVNWWVINKLSTGYTHSHLLIYLWKIR